RLPLNQLTPYLLPFAHNSPHQKKPRDRNSPDPRLPTLARMVSPDAYHEREGSRSSTLRSRANFRSQKRKIPMDSAIQA
ncbi:MAG: hypothetical protein NTX48_01515, partial [Planctomycetales bacterium]|nr:hypothetical protein [Planctomycetales bacterium]